MRWHAEDMSGSSGDGSASNALATTMPPTNPSIVALPSIVTTPPLSLSHTHGLVNSLESSPPSREDLRGMVM